jgi:hypothetical protein
MKPLVEFEDKVFFCDGYERSDFLTFQGEGGVVTFDALLDPFESKLNTDTFFQFLNIPIDQFKPIK